MKKSFLFLYSRILICSLLGIFIFTISASAQRNLPGTYSRYFSLDGKQMLPKQPYRTEKNKGSGQQRVTSNLPDCDIYLPDTSATGWRLANRRFYTYDSLGRYTSRTVYDLGNNPVEKDSIVLDRNNKELINANYEWHTGINNWIPKSGHTIMRIYLPNGKENQALHHDIMSSAWFYKSDVSVYNTANNLTEFTETYPNNPTRNERMHLAYNSPAGAATEITYQHNLSGAWEYLEKHVNFTWHRFATMMPSAYTAQRWVNNSWEDFARVNVVFDSLGGYVFTEQVLDSGTWRNNFRRSVTIDAKGNYIGLIDEIWLNATWTRRYEEVQLLTYNQADQVTERISRFWAFYNLGNMGWKDELKEVYYQNQVTSTAKPLPAPETVHLYPNPTENLLTIELPWPAFTAQLSDLTGKLILNRKLLASETKQLQLETLKPGIYLLTLETEKGKTVRKIVKN